MSVTALYFAKTNAIILNVNGVAHVLPPAEAARVQIELCAAISAFKIAHGIKKTRSVLKPIPLAASAPAPAPAPAPPKPTPPSPPTTLTGPLRHTHTATPKRLRPLPPRELASTHARSLADLVPLKMTGRRR
jgi:hypothetical protein